MALLRGINVGGKNVIRMADLKSCFEAMGFTDVATYIQSGNVLFRTAPRPVASLEAAIQRALRRRFAYAAKVVVVDGASLRRVAGGAPRGFGAKPSKYRYDVIFLKPPLTAAAAMKSVSLKEGVDRAASGKGVLYFSRLISRATQSRLPKLVSMPVYQRMTIRNWNTVTKLLALMAERE